MTRAEVVIGTPIILGTSLTYHGVHHSENSHPPIACPGRYRTFHGTDSQSQQDQNWEVANEPNPTNQQEWWDSGLVDPDGNCHVSIEVKASALAKGK
jgi:hypothetical protein